MGCGCEHASRDPADPWRNASDADANTYRLLETVYQSRDPRGYPKRAKEVAEAFEIAADAWEELGDVSRADYRRERADSWHREAFIFSHRHLSYGYYLVSDAEARRLSDGMPPRPGRFILFRFTPWSVGPRAELHRITLSVDEVPDRKRRWAYAVLGVR